RDDVFPPEITTELATLQQDVRPVATPRIRDAVARGLGRGIEAHFAWFDPEPLAAASIAQVHRATTLDGRAVVCKVRRPGVERQVEDDLALLGSLAELLDQRVDEVRRYDPRGLFAEFAESLRGELDFRREAEALARIREVVGDTAIVPEPLPELSSERVLTMTYVPGTRLSAVHDPEVRAGLARQLLRTFVRQILRAGVFHADPHPGNLMVADGRLVLLDFGAVGTFSTQMREELVGIATAAAQRDGHQLARAMLPLIAPPGPPDVAVYEAQVGTFLHDLLAQDLGAVRLRDLSEQVWQLSRDHALRLRPGYLQLLRTVATLDGVIESLDPGLDPVRAAQAYVLGETVAVRAETAVHTVRASLPSAARIAFAGSAIAAGVAGLIWWLL
ncbi:MAG: AarF/ABC1/UbiB kinase family protein, partial [Myxococcota bacterium]